MEGDLINYLLDLDLIVEVVFYILFDNILYFIGF